MRNKLFCVLRISRLPEASFLYMKHQLQHLYSTVYPQHIRLVFICDDNEYRSSSKEMAQFVKEIDLPRLDDKDICHGLLRNKYVSIVSSDRAGLGKTQKIKNLSLNNGCSDIRTLVITGYFTRKDVVTSLLAILKEPDVDALHIDILDVHINCEELLNDILFEILSLSIVCSSTVLGESVVYVPVSTIFIEIGNVVGFDLISALPLCQYMSDERRIHLKWNSLSNPMYFNDQAPDLQLVCNYLLAINENRVDNEIQFQALTVKSCWDLLSEHFIKHLINERQDS